MADILTAYRDAVPRQRWNLRALLRSPLASAETSSLTAAAIRDYAASRKRDAVSDGTILRELGALRAALHWAHREGLIDAPPTFRMPVSKPPPRERWATREQAALFMLHCSGHVRLAAQIAFASGARIGAILQLRWGDVDLDARRLSFGVGRGNKRRALIPIHDDLAVVLAAAREAATCEHVVEWRSQPVASITTGWKKAASRSGMPWLTPHIARHSVATWLAMDPAVSDDQAARYLGMSIPIFRSVYGKHSPDYLEAAAVAARVKA